MHGVLSVDTHNNNLLIQFHGFQESQGLIEVQKTRKKNVNEMNKRNTETRKVELQ